MKKMGVGKFLCAGVLLTGALVFVSARSVAAPVDVPFVAGAELVTDVTITPGTQSINFGKIVPPPTGGPQVFTISPGAAPVIVGPGTGDAVPNSGAQPGQVIINGPANQDVALTSDVNTTPVDCNFSGGGKVAEVQLTAVNFDQQGGEVPGPVFTLSGTGDTIGVTGTVSIGAGALGNYTCSFPVSVDFSP